MYTTKKEIPVGVKDGINRDFMLSQAPAPESLDLYLNGVEQTSEYTLNGAVITFHYAPLASDRIHARYVPETSEGH